MPRLLIVIGEKKITFSHPSPIKTKPTYANDTEKNQGEERLHYEENFFQKPKENRRTWHLEANRLI